MPKLMQIMLVITDAELSSTYVNLEKSNTNISNISTDTLEKKTVPISQEQSSITWLHYI